MGDKLVDVNRNVSYTKVTNGFFHVRNRSDFRVAVKLYGITHRTNRTDENVLIGMFVTAWITATAVGYFTDRTYLMFVAPWFILTGMLTIFCLSMFKGKYRHVKDHSFAKDHVSYPCSPTFLRWCGLTVDSFCRYFAARHENTPQEVLTELVLNTGDPYVIVRAYKNPSTSVLLLQSEFELLANVSARTPGELTEWERNERLSYLVQNPNVEGLWFEWAVPFLDTEFVAEMCARAHDCSEELLLRLAGHGSESVRQLVAENPNSSQRVRLLASVGR